MASMKLWNSNHGYGANQSKMSQYHHQQYNMSQSSQSHQSHLDSSMHPPFDQFDHAAKGSTRYHAHANSVLPTPSIHVQESSHVTQALKRQESHTDQQTCPNPALSGYSASGAMFDGANHNGKIERIESFKKQESHTEQQWSTKNGSCSNSAHSSFSAAGAMYDGGHQVGKIEGGGTMKKQEIQIDQQWSAKNDACPIPGNSSYSAGGAMYDDAHRIGKMEHGLANTATQISSYGQANQHGQSMFNSQDGKSYKYNTNSLDVGECLSPPVKAKHHGQSMFNSQDGKSYEYNTSSLDVEECLSPVKAKHHGQTTIKEQANQSYNFGKNSFENDWISKPNNYSGSNQFNHSTQNKYQQQDHHGWNDKANKFYGSAEMGHSNHAMHQEGLMMGSKDQSWVSSPTQPNQSNLAMHKSQYMSEKMDHALVNSPTRANSSAFNMHKEDHLLGEIDGGFGRQSTHCSNAIQANQYGQSKYMGQGGNACLINDQGIYSGHSKNSGGHHPYGSSHTMYSGQDRYGQSAYHGGEEDIFNFNNRDCMDNLGHKQYNYSSNNMHKGQEQYGSMMGHSGHSAYSKHHGYDDAENVDDIMDEILTKYPAHNVSGGYGSCASHPKQYSYASSTSSSSASKFEMRGMMGNGGPYNNNGFGNQYGCDY